MDSLLDLLERATTVLAQNGTVKDRLADAYARHLIQIDADELPEPLRDGFASLCCAMQRERPQPHESTIRASVRKMSNEEAAHHATQVVAIFAAVARNTAQLRRLGRNASGAPIVKLLAAEG